MSRHGENAQRRSERQRAEAGRRQANEALTNSGRTVYVPRPCYCTAGVERTKAAHSDPNYDGRHWHASDWIEFEKAARQTDAKPKW